MTNTLRKAGAGLLALAAPGLIAVLYPLLRDRLPDPLPVHWNFAGAVDGTAGQAGFTVTLLAITAALALGVIAAVLLVRPDAAARAVAAMTMFGVWICAGTWLVTSVISLDADRAHEVSLPWYGVAALVLVPVIVAAATYFLLPGRWQDLGGDTPVLGEQIEPSLVLAPGETVTWIDHERSVVMETLAAVITLGALAAVLWIPASATSGAVVAAVIGVAVALVLWWMSRITVRIDDRGVQTLWGPIYWPRGRIPLEKIASVRVEHIHPMQWGGWGYRLSKRGTATIIKGGPGLVITRRGHRPDHAITLPHAAEGAETLRALLARASRQS